MRPERPSLASVGNQTAGRLLTSGVLRAKLRIGSVDDPAEHEADRMAAAALQGGRSITSDEGLCPSCKATHDTIRRKPRAHAGSPETSALRLGSARPLGSGERAFFESRYQANLSDVRIHDNSEAAAGAADIDARAFNLGSHIGFGRDQYRPQTSEGRLLLAHELAHVLQQSESAGPGKIRRQHETRGESTAAHCTHVAVELPNRITFVGSRGAVSATLATTLPPGDYWITYAPALGQYSVGAIGYNPTEPPRIDVSAATDPELLTAYRESITREGVRLHVAGEAGPDVVAVPDASITASYAEGLGEAQVAAHADIYRARLTTLGSGVEYEVVYENLRIIQSEQLRRQSPDLTIVGETARPPVLPIDGGFILQPADGVPSDVIAGIPEGGMIFLPTDRAAAEPVQGGSQDTLTITPLDANLQPLAWAGAESFRPTDVTTPLAAGSRAMLQSVNLELIQQGLGRAGPNAIGIVGVPRWFTPGQRVPELLLDVWGHTAVYVRQGGQITMVRGFNPQMGGSQLLPFLRQWGAVRSGAGNVPAAITNDAYLFTVTGARSIEYPVAPAIAEQLAGRLPAVGPVPASATPSSFTAQPAAYRACNASNCVLWAVEQAETVLGGPVGPASRSVSVTSLGESGTVAARTASQGRLIAFMQGVQAGEEALPTAAATGAPVAAEMSSGLKVVKWGGRAFFVIGLATVPLEVFLAPEGQTARTAVGATAGFAGGLAAGATAGLVCGPGAPLCSVVLGITFGVAGALGARALAETIYDALVLLSEHPEAIVAPPTATSLALRGGWGGLLRSPANVAREMRQQRAGGSR